MPIVSMDQVLRDVTDDWVSTFSDPANQNGFMWRMAAKWELPEGVDPTDDRVKLLCQKAMSDLKEVK